MKKLLLILLLSLVLRIPLEVWNKLTPEQQEQGIRQTARAYAEEKQCKKIQVMGGQDDKFYYLKFDCASQEL